MGKIAKLLGHPSYIGSELVVMEERGGLAILGKLQKIICKFPQVS